jgi:hypothetical protein
MGHYNLSAYYVTHESQYYSGPDSKSRPVPSLNNSTANKYFLFSEGGVCTQGTGKLNNGDYIGCTAHVDWDYSNPEHTYIMPPDDKEHRENLPFVYKHALTPPKFIPLNTVAVCNGGSIPRDESGSVEIRIVNNDLRAIMTKYNEDNVFMSTDVGGRLCTSPLNTIDIFIGEEKPYQEDPGNNLYHNIALPIIDIDDAEVEMKVLK